MQLTLRSFFGMNERALGCLFTLDEGKGAYPAWLYLPTNREFESFREQLESADELPDAFFFSSDYLAFSLLPLLNEAEIYKDKFPRIIGFDNLVGRFPSPYTFSSIDIDSETRGREALRLLLRQIRERNCPYCHIRIATQLVVHGEK